jgi:hypothetical protein
MMSEALVDGVFLIEMDEEILEEFGFKRFRRSITDENTHKTKDRVTRTPLKQGVNSSAPEG